MVDKIQKALDRLSLKEKKSLNVILQNIKLGHLKSLDVKKLKGHSDIFRVRKGKIRIIYRIEKGQIFILAIERRNETTYNNI